ncbi:sulfurtransferase, partial [Vibrio sp. OPT46]|nr:sulfurtransferase [Vibrio sp. OPT46]
AAPRAWWMFKAMGHDNVRVLNGGLPAWIEAGFPVESTLSQPSERGNFAGKLNQNAFLSAQDVLAHSTNKSANIIDARAKAR